LGERTFEDLRIPLALVAVDVNSQREVVLRHGRVVDAVRATIAVPGLFTPVERDGQLLVDGGVLNNLPADVARSMGADVVIAVDVHSDEPATPYFKLHPHRYVPNGLAETLDVLWICLIMMMAEIERHKLAQAQPDVIVRPDIPPQITTFSGFRRAAEIISAGERAARDALPAIRECV